MSTIDENGLIIDRYDEVRAKFVEDLKAIWGEGIKTDEDSVTGQLISIICERIADQNELIELSTTIWNPGMSFGVFLSELMKVNGITRNEPIYSTVAVDVTANSAPASILAGDGVSDPGVGEVFKIDAAVSLAPFETKTVSATAENEGNIVAPAGTLTKIENPRYGWESATNASDASVGALEESDTEARIRRDISAAQTGTANVSAIYTALNDYDPVDYAQVYENKTNEIDANGIEPGNIWAVVSGGTDAEVAEIIFNKTPAGTPWKGDVVVAYLDPITGQYYNVKFSRPTEVPVFITFNLTKNSAYPSNGDDLIKEATVTFFEGNFYLNGALIEPFALGEDVVSSRIYTPANIAPGHSIDSVYIGTAADPTSPATLAIAADQIAGTEFGNIKVA